MSPGGGRHAPRPGLPTFLSLAILLTLLATHRVGNRVRGAVTHTSCDRGSTGAIPQSQ